MKISISQLQQGFLQSIKRFPFQILVAAAVTILGWRMIYTKFGAPQLYQRLIMTCNLIFVFSLACDLYFERYTPYAFSKKLLYSLLYLLLGIGFYFILDSMAYEVNIFRFFAFSVAFHLMVSFMPYIKDANQQAFWQYNKTLFLQILTSGLYSGVLYMGIALAIKAVQELWHLNVSSNMYAYVFTFIAAFFSSVFFLSGVTKDFDQLEKDDSYPKGLKVFTQYILIPLMTVYLVILFLYEINILIHRSLPNGIVSWLIMGYSVFGILSLLLIYPIRESENNKWIRTFGRFFYIMLFPLLILLFVAIGMRVSDYGLTEDRYSIIAIGIWLTIVAIYSLLKPTNIKFIPIMLCIFALLAVYGPQSAGTLSKKSQLKEMKAIMSGNNKKIKDRGYDVLSYMITHYGIVSLQPLTDTPLKPVENSLLAKTTYSYDIHGEAMDTMRAILKLKKDAHFTESSQSQSYIVEPQKDFLLDISGYDYLYYLNKRQDSFSIEKNTWIMSGDTESSIKISNKKKDQIVFDMDVLSNIMRKKIKEDLFEKKNFDTYYAPDSMMQLSQKLDGFTFTIKITSLHLNKENRELADGYYFYDAVILIKKP